MVLSCTVSETRRLIGWKLRIFPTPLSGAPLAMFPLKFRSEVNHEETIVMGLSSSEDRMIMIVAWVILTWYWYWTVTDGQTESIIASTALCIASYADLL